MGGRLPEMEVGRSGCSNLSGEGTSRRVTETPELVNDDHPGQGDPPKVVEIAERTHARGHYMLPGKLDRHELNRGERLVVNVVRAPDGDFRDWNAIRAWADEIGPALKSVATADTLPDAPSQSRHASAYSG